MKMFLSLLLINCLVLGCNETRNSKNGEAQFLLLEGELLRLKMDERTSNISSYLFFDTESELLYSLNSNDNELQLFDIEKGELVKRLAFDVEGERGVGRITAAYVHSPDSVFLFPSVGNRLFVTDTSGLKLEKLGYESPEGYGNALISSTYFASQPKVNKGKLYAKSFFGGNYSFMTNEALAAKHLSYGIDLKTGETEFLPHRFPKDYWLEKKTHYEFSMAFGAKKVVYSFFSDHALYYAGPLVSDLKTKPAKSRFFKTIMEPIPLEGTREDRMRYVATTPHYGSIIYDKYRSVFYRFCYPKVEVEDESKLYQLINFPGPFSVMVFDQDLNVIGETLFDSANQYATKNYFVGKKGLYVSINHPDNPDNKEDYMSFRLLGLEEINDGK